LVLKRTIRVGKNLNNKVMNNQSVPYAVVSEGALSFFKEDIPLWVIMLLCRIHYFNSRKNEKYTLYIDKETIKLRIRPNDILVVLDQLSNDGDIVCEKANSGLYLILLSGDLLKNLDILT